MTAAVETAVAVTADEKVTPEVITQVVTPKKLSLVEELRAERPELFVEAIQFTDDISIPIPTQETAKKIAEAKDQEEMVRVMFGDKFEQIEEYCSALPVGAGVVALAKLVEALTSSLPDVNDVMAEYGLDRKQLEKQIAEKLKTTSVE